MKSIFTIGHSNHSIKYFINLLKIHNITAIFDVRSQPYSQYCPQYSKNELSKTLSQENINYFFLGHELGARIKNPACYVNGKVKYDLLKVDPHFELGLKKINYYIDHFRIALMCAEKEPLDCHRSILIARCLSEDGFSIFHIHANGELEEQKKMELRMLKLLKMHENDLFKSKQEIIEDAYSRREQMIAYEDRDLK